MVADSTPAVEASAHVQQAFQRLSAALKGLPDAPLNEAAAVKLLTAMGLAPQVGEPCPAVSCACPQVLHLQKLVLNQICNYSMSAREHTAKRPYKKDCVQCSRSTTAKRLF